MTQFQKSLIGPQRSRPCQGCGKLVSVSLAAYLAVLPFLVSIVVGGLRSPHGIWQAAIIVGIGAILMFAMHAFLVPLVGREA